MSSFLVRSILLTTTFLTTSCGSSGSSDSPGSPGSSVTPQREVPEPPLTECLPDTSRYWKPENLRFWKPGKPPFWNPQISDPHGQGADLFGFGFERSGTFVRVDRFDLGSVRNAAGALIPGVEIRAHALASVQGRTADEPTQEDWRGAVFVGQLHCTNPKLKGRTHSIRARVVQAVSGTAPTILVGRLKDQSLWLAYKLELELEPGQKLVQVCRGLLE
jgi:hypothetical protein